MALEFISSVDQFQEQLLLCRPKDVFSFAIKFYADEKTPNSQEAHALHALPYLICSHEEFRSAACIIYCHNIANDAAYKDYLDGDRCLEIIQKLNLGDLWFQSSTIDEIVSNRLKSLKRVDFNLFVSALRLPISLYQLLFWLKDEISDCTKANKLGNDLSDFSKTMNIDLNRLKSHSIRYKAKVTSSTLHSNNAIVTQAKTKIARINSHCYHLHDGSWTDNDTILWNKTLIATMDDFLARNHNVITIEELSNEFIKKYENHL